MLDEGVTKDLVPIVCPSCRDLVSANGQLEDVAPGDAISAFCSACERTIEVAAPIGIDALRHRPDAIVPAVTEFAPGAPSA